MTRDYKHVSDRSVASRPGRPGTPGRRGSEKPKRGFPAGVMLGLALGLGGAVVVHFYHTLRPGFAPPPAPVEVPDSSSATGEEKPYDYDFYDILSEMEILVPEPEEVNEETRPVYVLQAGSFKARRTAEFLQERLKALGLESEVQKVEMGDGAVWYRVRLGPYDSLSRVNNIRIDLRKRGIESLLKKR